MAKVSFCVIICARSGDSMLEKIDKLLSPKLLIILTCILLIISFNVYHEQVNYVQDVKKQVETIKEENKIDIKKLQDKYHNTDIVAYLEIPDLISFPIVQTTDNDYYLNYNLSKEKDIRGTLFLDFRNEIEDKKLLIYGHSGKEEGLPFNELIPYQEESFYQKHKDIYLYTSTNKYTYRIFSSYFEGIDFDYVNLEDFNGLTYKEHLYKLKNKSLYNVDIELDDNSKVIILQTCNIDTTSKEKYQLVIGKQIKKD